jgi:hypothetical protein
MAIKGYQFSAWELFTEQVLTGGKSTKALFSGGVYKYARYTLVAGRGYDRAIEILCGKLGIDFANWTPQPHNYGIHIGGNVLTHNADLNLEIGDINRRDYAQFMMHNNCQIEVQYFDAELRPLTYEQVAPYLPNKSSKKQTDLGIDKADQIRTINPSIKSITRSRHGFLTRSGCRDISGSCKKISFQWKMWRVRMVGGNGCSASIKYHHQCNHDVWSCGNFGRKIYSLSSYT